MLGLNITFFFFLFWRDIANLNALRQSKERRTKKMPSQYKKKQSKIFFFAPIDDINFFCMYLQDKERAKYHFIIILYGH